MESIANRPRPMASRMQRTYRIEMGGRTVLVSLSLAVLTGLVVFYMGVLTGKGSRTAQMPIPEAVPTEAQSGLPVGPGKLAFSDALLKDKPVVEDLLKNQQQTTQQTQDLLARAQRELTVEEVPAPGLATARRDSAPGTQPPAASAPAKSQTGAPPQAAATVPNTAQQQTAAPPHRDAPAKPAARQPANKAEPAPSGAEGLFTVQVFSSQSRESASQLVNRLKGMGFSAYLNQFQDASHVTWYRVRVGKTNRPEAERLKSSLEQKANLKTMQVLQL